MTVAGLEPGDYLFTVTANIDTNHDGSSDGGSENDICRFHVSKGQTKAATCQHSGLGVLTYFAATPDFMSAQVYKLGNDTGVLVRTGVFS